MDSLFHIILLLSFLSLTSTQQIYVYNHKRHRGRVTLPPPGFPQLTKWSGRADDPIPKIIGDDFLYGKVEINTKPNTTCNDYFRQERGKYQDTNDNQKVKWVYPFKSWVKSCDVSRFLWCKDSKCNCWPGKYWDEERQTCVSGFEQDCSKFEAVTFQIDQQCGYGMECVDKPGGGKFCICFKESSKFLYTGIEKDIFDQDKFHCREEVALDWHDKCHEYRALRWNKSPAGDYNLVNVTHTGCGDTGGYDVEPNFYCRFPKEMTGKDPKNNGTSIKYGQRIDGTCECTDWQLGYQKGTGNGCVVIAGIQCKAGPTPEGKVEYTARGSDWNSKKLFNKTGSCGGLATCAGLGLGHAGNCKCKDSHKGEKVGIDFVSKTCMVGAKSGVNGDSKKKVGDPCHAYQDPCVTSEGQKCTEGSNGNATCTCSRGYVEEEDKQCKGLYGVECETKEQCATDKGFICEPVPELVEIDDENKELDANRTYCVCGNEYLFSESGYCGACNLQLHFMQMCAAIILLALKFLGLFPNS